MEEYLFLSKIHCKNCGGKFRGKMERKVITYLCSNYSNYGNKICSRRVITQNELLFVVDRHLPKSEVVRIDIYEDKIIIFYEDNSTSLISNDKVIF